MKQIDMDSKITIKQAYLTMFEYLDRWWSENGKPDAVGDLLSELQLWDNKEGKRPMDEAIFPEWLVCATKVINDENSGDGYRSADINLTK